jgi:hypothetical protein
VTLRTAKPGDRFDVQLVGEGKFVLTRLEPVPEPGVARVRIKKRNGFSIGVLDRTMSEDALKEALSEFP